MLVRRWGPVFFEVRASAQRYRDLMGLKTGEGGVERSRRRRRGRRRIVVY
jgi:hypothetical protein